MLDQHVVGSFEELKAVSDPLRSRILAVLRRGAMTTLQVARELGEKPTRLYHHVDTLERAGLIRLVREQPKRGTVERYFEPVARVFVIDRDLFNPSRDTPAGSAATAQALVDGVVGHTLEELRRRIADGDLPLHDRSRMKLARLHLRASESQLARLMQAVEALVEEANRLAGDADASDDTLREYRLQLALYPLDPLDAATREPDDHPPPLPEGSSP